jgi:hypothetical protein
VRQFQSLIAKRVGHTIIPGSSNEEALLLLMQANKLAISLKRTSTQDTACTTHPAWQPLSSPNRSTHPPTHALSCLPRTSSFLLVYLQIPQKHYQTLRNTILLIIIITIILFSLLLLVFTFCSVLFANCSILKSIVCSQRMRFALSVLSFFLLWKIGLCCRYVANKSAQ